MALRDIKYGEELTFDYSCVSESKEEFKKATCLCGSLGCRGSFVYYADDDSFMQVMKKVNPFLRRTAVLLDAGQRELTEEEAVAFLWDGPHGVVREVCQTGLEKETDVDALELLTRVREKLRAGTVRGLGRVRQQLRARGDGRGK